MVLITFYYDFGFVQNNNGAWATSLHHFFKFHSQIKMDEKADIWHSKETFLNKANTVSKKLDELDLDYFQDTQQYEVQSKLFLFADLKENPSFNVKRHKNTLYLGLLNQN